MQSIYVWLPGRLCEGWDQEQAWYGMLIKIQNIWKRAAMSVLMFGDF